MLGLSLILLALGVVAGIARGGRVTNVLQTPFRRGWLVFLGLAVQITAELVALFLEPRIREGLWAGTILAISYGLLIVFVVLNRRLPGALLIGTGLLLNVAVIIPNQGMPVSVDAARAAGFDPYPYLDSAVKHVEMGPDTFLPWLGDIIPLPFLRQVVSVGDAFLAIGMFMLVQKLVRYRPRRLRGSDPGPVQP